MKHISTPLSGLALVVAACLSSSAVSAADLSGLSPNKWPRAEYDLYLKRNFSPQTLTAAEKQPALADGTHGMVVGTSDALAIHAGVETLDAGGTAIDAAITTALAQVTLNTGSIISFAGFTTLIYYDHASGKTYSMNAAFNTVRGETDPMTIPPTDRGMPTEQLFQNYPYSGRAVLVPGFMAGMEAAHKRFGKLPFAVLFRPSIYWAKNGIPVDPRLQYMIAARKDALMRRPDTKSIFTRPDGQLLQAGDTLRQPALAYTLSQVAAKGAQYMYTGAWAKKFVDAVRLDGGKITLDDMKNYKANWEEPTRVPFDGYEVVTSGNVGGTSLGGAFMLLDQAKLQRFGAYDKSPEAMYDMMQIAQYSGAAAKVTSITPERYREVFGDFPSTSGYLLDPEHAVQTWQRIADGTIGPKATAAPPITPGHSAGIVVVDKWGNVAAMVHTINTSLWGGGALFIDGVSVSDAGWFQLQGIAAAGPGHRLADPTAPAIVLKDGAPVFATATVGGGLHEKTIQVLYKMMAEGERPDNAISSHVFHRLEAETSGPGPAAQIVTVGDFDPAVLEGVRKRGLPVDEVPNAKTGLARGFLIAVAIDPKTKAIEGAYDTFIPTGMAEGN